MVTVKKCIVDKPHLVGLAGQATLTAQIKSVIQVQWNWGGRIEAQLNLSAEMIFQK